MTKQHRTIVIITEGAAPALLDRWCEAGALPGFARLRREGAHGPLSAEGTPYEPPGLLSVLTGRHAADHGFFSYWSCHDPEYSPRVLGSGTAAIRCSGSTRRSPGFGSPPSGCSAPIRSNRWTAR